MREVRDMLLADGFITETASGSIGLTSAGVEEAERLIRLQNLPPIDAPFPTSHAEIREELDTWARRQHEGLPGSEFWEQVGSRINHLRYLDQRMSEEMRNSTPQTNYCTHVEGTNARTTINGVDNSMNVVAQTVNVHRPKGRREKIVLPGDVIGGSSEHRRYASYLLDRYKQFASAQRDRQFKPAVIYAVIRRQFGATWEWVPITRFAEFTSFMQQRIDKTIVGKNNSGKGRQSYSSFEKYRETHGNLD